MARQKGTIYITGTLSGLTFYKLDEQYYVRRKSSLSKKRFQEDPAFEGSRLRSRQFGVAAQLASEVYGLLSKDQRKHGLIGKLTGKVNQLLQEGKAPEEVKAILLHSYYQSADTKHNM